MTNPQPHHRTPPTPKQLSYLRDLALHSGQSFAYPKSVEEANREIKRLRRARRTSRADRRREAQGISRDMAIDRGDSAKVQANEVGGYGASARWR